MPGRGKPLERTGAAPSTAQHGPAPTRPTGGSSTVSFRPMTGRRGGPRPPAPRHCSGGRWAEQVPRCELGTPCRRAMPAVPGRSAPLVYPSLPPPQRAPAHGPRRGWGACVDVGTVPSCLLPSSPSQGEVGTGPSLGAPSRPEAQSFQNTPGPEQVPGRVTPPPT